MAGTLFRFGGSFRGLRINWLMVGILCPLPCPSKNSYATAVPADPASRMDMQNRARALKMSGRRCEKPEDHELPRGHAIDAYSPM
jgi:hypothetical protein